MACMRTSVILFAIAAFVLALVVGGQIISCEIANIELQDNMRDLAAQLGARIGFSPPSSDEDLRGTVVRIAKQHDIDLDRDQVSVRRAGTGDKQTIYLEADYTQHITLPGFSFALHFTPTTAEKRP